MDKRYHEELTEDMKANLQKYFMEIKLELFLRLLFQCLVFNITSRDEYQMIQDNESYP